MGVIDGQAVSASVTNAAFLNKNQSDAMPFDLAIQAGLNFPKSVISTSGAINALDSSKVNVKLTGSSVILNGAVAGTDGDILIVLNATGSNITVNSLSGSASSANQFQLNASTATIATNQSAFFQYETTSAKWYQIGSSASGAGGGSKNYFSLSNGNPTFSSGQVSPWSACTLTLSSGIPSGAPTLTATQMALAVTSTNPLAVSSSAYNAQLTKSASNAQGQGFISGALTIDREDLAKVLYGSFSYEVVSGSPNLSGGSSQDIEIWIYNTVSGVWTQPAGYRGMNQGSGQGKVIFNFQTDSTAANNSYRIAVITAQTSASAYTVNFNDFSIGPNTIVNGAAVTDWQTYTPTLTNCGTSPTVGAFYWRRVGANIEIQGTITSGTTPSGASNFSIPSGLSINTSAIPVSANTTASPGSVVGQFGNSATASVQLGNIVTACGTSATVLYFGNNTGGSAAASLTPTVINASQTYTIRCEVPITGLSSNVQLSQDTDTRVVAAARTTLSSTTITGGTALQFTTSSFDTHGAFTSNSTYTIPVSGFYRVTVSGINSSTTASNLEIFVNGVTQGIITTLITAGRTSGSGVVSVKSGDTITIVPSSSITAATTNGQFYVERLSGPSVIAATESVNSSYSSSSGQAINNNVASFIDFPTKSFDTHNIYSAPSGAYSAASGSWATTQPTWTIPVSGKYYVYAVVGIGMAAAGTSQYREITIYKNGVQIKEIQNSESSAGTYNNSIAISSVIQCSTGDYIQIKATQATGANKTMAANAIDNYMDIVRVGN